MRKSFLSFSAALIVGLLFVGCSPEKILEQGDDAAEAAETASDFAAAESAFEEILDIVEEEAKQQGDLNGFVSSEEAEDRSCAEVNITSAAPGEFPVTMTLNFGEGCALADGRIVSGVITTVFTGKLRNDGSAYTISFDNFILDGRTISGTKTVTNNGLNADNQLNFTISIENGLMIYPNGDQVTFVSERTRTWVEGQDTKFETDGIDGIKDDVWEIVGTATGTSKNGNGFEVTITSPLRSEMNCRWITAGTIEIDTDAFNQSIEIDYGEGNCDDKAQVTFGLIKRDITL
jgi:hypothetical protein